MCSARTRCSPRPCTYGCRRPGWRAPTGPGCSRWPPRPTASCWSPWAAREAVRAAGITGMLLAARLAVPVMAAALDVEGSVTSIAEQLQGSGSAQLALAPYLVGPEVDPGLLDAAAKEAGCATAEPLGAYPAIGKLVLSLYATTLGITQGDAAGRPGSLTGRRRGGAGSRTARRARTGGDLLRYGPVSLRRGGRLRGGRRRRPRERRWRRAAGCRSGRPRRTS